MTANHEEPRVRGTGDRAGSRTSADTGTDTASGLAAPPAVEPGSSAVPVDLEELGRAVKEAQYRHHRALDTRLSAVGTTLAQWDALRAIARTPGASAHELAVATFQGDQSFGTLASRLAAQHLIERRPGRGRMYRAPSDGDRRARLEGGAHRHTRCPRRILRPAGRKRTGHAARAVAPYRRSE